MTIREMIRKTQDNLRGYCIQNRAWQTTISPEKLYVTLWHYTTPMLEWRTDHPQSHWVGISLGYGSVSDQNGMNIAFRELNIPARYDRSGGVPRITRLI